MTLSYDDLVTAATVGITRKPLAMTRLGGAAAGYDGVLDAGDPAGALLDAAALLTVARRAGVQPRRGMTVPAQPPDSAPALSPRAVDVLRTLRWRPNRTHGLNDADLLADLLTAAADAGYVATAQLLTDLLEAATDHPALRRAVARVLSVRGRWLAQYQPQWRASIAAADALRDPETWRAGTPADRLAYLTGLRSRDPAAARDLLAAAWAQEHGRERARFIAVLSHGLSPADEEFLEVALKDRAATVHSLALQLLKRLPDTAFRRRGSERAAGLLRVEGDESSRGVRLAVTLPGGPDAAAARDGVTAKPPSPTIRAEAWWLTGVLAAAPLSDWTAWFGRSPREIVALPVEGGLRADVLAGWRLAAASQGDPEWARALLDAGRDDRKPGNDARGNCDENACGNGSGRPPQAWPPDHVLAGALPPGEWAAVLLAGARLSYSSYSPPYRPRDYRQLSDDLLAEVLAYPPPWPPAFADAVIAAFDREVTAVLENPPRFTPYTRELADQLLTAAGRCMPVAGNRDYAAVLTRLGSTSPFRSSHFTSAAHAITLRRAFYEEIS